MSVKHSVTASILNNKSLSATTTTAKKEEDGGNDTNLFKSCNSQKNNTQKHFSNHKIKYSLFEETKTVVGQFLLEREESEKNIWVENGCSPELNSRENVCLLPFFRFPERSLVSKSYRLP